MKVDDRFVKANVHGKKKQKTYINAAIKGKLHAYIKHPVTGEAIFVHPQIVKRIKKGEHVSLEEIIKGIQ
jgi:hypothetical protein